MWATKKDLGPIGSAVLTFIYWALREQAKYISIAFFWCFLKFFLYSYFYLGLAALIIMGKESLCNTENLLLWAVNKQMRLEGGFQVSLYIYIMKWYLFCLFVCPIITCDVVNPLTDLPQILIGKLGKPNGNVLSLV